MIFSTHKISEEVKAHRLKARLTQSELAELAKVNVQTISRIERGVTSPNVDTVISILTALTDCEAGKKKISLSFTQAK